MLARICYGARAPDARQGGFYGAGLVTPPGNGLLGLSMG